MRYFKRTFSTFALKSAAKVFFDAMHNVIEISLNLLLAAGCIALLVRSKGHGLRRFWALSGMALAAGMLLVNCIELRIALVDEHNGQMLLDLLPTIKWYLFVHALSLYMVGSLRPGWFSFSRIVTLSLPPIIACTVALSYIRFDGTITPLDSAADISLYMGQPDVQVRLGLFLLSVLTPMFASIDALYRTPSRGRWVPILGFALMSSSCVLLLSACDGLSVRIAGYIAAIVPVGLSIFCLADGKTGSLRRNTADSPSETTISPRNTAPDPTAEKLYLRIEEHVRTTTPFTDANYSLRRLSQEINASCALAIRALKSGGFSGFHEWVNFLRLEYFKELADRQPGATIKELMCRSGFTSRSSFYRHFCEQEAISPKEYLAKRNRAGGGGNFTLTRWQPAKRPDRSLPAQAAWC